MPRRLLRISLLIGLTAGWTAQLATQQDQRAQFRAAVHVVRLDVLVLDEDRRPIRGLGRDDFAVYVDGVLQPIVDVSEVNYLVPSTAGQAARPAVPDGFVSNQASPTRRAFVVVLDDALTPASPFMIRYAKDAARRFVDGLQADDLVAVVFSWNSTHNQDFTTDRERLVEAIGAFQAGPEHEYVRAGTERIEQASARTLQWAVERLHEVPHLRGAVVWISPGLRGSGQEFDTGQRLDGIRTVGEPDTVYGSELRSVVGQSRYARVPIYTISNQGLVAPGPGRRLIGGLAATRLRNSFLKTVADNSGGFAIVDTNDFGPGVQQILLENSSRYVIGYEPTYPLDEVRSRRLRIRVERPSATVFPSGRVLRSPRATERQQTKSPRAALAGILPVSDIAIAIRTTLGPFDLESRRANLTIDLAVGPVDGPSASANLLCVLFDAARLNEVVSSEASIALDGRGISWARLGMPVEVGRYNLRCGLYAAALDKLGSVYSEVRVAPGRR